MNIFFTSRLTESIDDIVGYVHTDMDSDDRRFQLQQLEHNYRRFITHPDKFWSDDGVPSWIQFLNSETSKRIDLEKLCRVGTTEWD